MLYRILPILLITFFCAFNANADDVSKINDALAKLVPDSTPDNVVATPIPGIYEVNYGEEVFYISEDGRFLIQGAIADLQNQVNLTEESQERARTRLNPTRANLISDLDEKDMVVFSPDKPQHTITVFTDTDCTYCRKLHSEMAQYNASGIKVRYLWFPRAGPNSEAFSTAVSVWCSKDRNAAMNKAKTSGEIEQATCENPVLEQYQLGQKVGVRGTPAIVLEDGELVTGYRSAKQITAMYDKKTQAAQ